MIELREHVSGFERLLRSVEGKSEITIKSYCTKVEELFQWYREDRSVPQIDISNIDRKDIESFLEYCYFQDNKNQTRLTKLIAIRRFWRYLVYEGVVKEDITAQIPRPKIRKGLVQKFTKEEILKLFAVMDLYTEKGLRDINILILGAFCGMRISEIIKLNMDDIIDDGNAIDINIIGKFDSPRTVYLWKSPSMFVRQWLAVRMSQGAGKNAPFLVSYRKGDNARTSRPAAPGIDTLLKKYAAIAGIRKQIVTMHMLRATHASDLRHIRGYDVFAIAERLGHKDTITTGRYIPVRDRISKEYPSLAVYWKEFNHIWEKKNAEHQD